METADNLKNLIYYYMNIADWIYHDLRLDCDGEAEARSTERLRRLYEEHGLDGCFGVAGAWGVKTIWRLEDGFRRIGRTDSPAVYPIPLDEIKHHLNEEQTRAMVSSQQFFSYISTGDVEMAYDIAKTVYDSSLDDVIWFMYAMLTLSIATSAKAKLIR